MRVLIADVSAHDNGEMNETWLDPLSGPEQMNEDIAALLAKGPFQPAEEWEVIAYEGMPDLGPHPQVGEIAEIAEAVEEYGDAMRAFVEWTGDREFLVNKFNDAYIGVFDSHAEFAEYYLNEYGRIEEVPVWIRDCISYERYWNSTLRYDFYEVDGYYFARNY